MADDESPLRMAITKIIAIRDRLDKRVNYAANGDKTSLNAGIEYAVDSDKTEQPQFVTTLNCSNAATAYAEMQATKSRFGKKGGVVGYHFIQSFAPGEVTPEQAHAIGVALAQRLFGERYEVVVGTHLDKLMMVRTKIFVKEDTKMLYTEKEKHEIERVKEVFAEHLRQSPDFELLWSDKVGYVWLTIGVNPVYVDTGIRIESAADLCGRCLDDVATDVLYMTGNDHALEAADPLELAEIKRRWEPYINQLPDYAYLCKDLLNGKM